MVTPKISIIIPTYNRSKYLPAAIDSALAQNYPALEIIIMDNCSEDDTSSVVSKYLNNPKIKYCKNDTNLGMVLNWRKGLYEHSTGEWFLILSDDDYLISDTYLSDAINLITTDKNIVMVCGNGIAEDMSAGLEKNIEFPFEGVESGKKFFLANGEKKQIKFLLCGVLFNKDLAIKLNSFSNKYNVWCDAELFWKSCLFGKVGVVKKNVSFCRYNHSSNTSQAALNDYNCLVNGVDWCFSPYAMAIDRKVFLKKDLENWWYRIIIVNVANTFANLFLYHKFKALSGVFDVARKVNMSFSDFLIVILRLLKMTTFKILNIKKWKYILN